MVFDSFLEQAMLFIAAALICVPIAKISRLGSVIGYLFAGILIGPFIFAFIREVESIFHFAEMGVVLLLFVIGLEMQPNKLRKMKNLVFGMGSLQVAVSALLFFLVALLFGVEARPAIVVGVALALSSTAFVLQLLAERNEMNTNYGRGAFSVLIFQDLAVVPILALIPLLATDANTGEQSIIMSFARSALVIFAVVLVGKFALNPMFRWISKLQLKELTTGAALLLVVGIAQLMVSIDLSMGLGAFLAGLLLAESEFRHELEANIEPFKGLLLGLFFICVGMSLDLSLMISEPLTVFGAAIGLIVLKCAIMYPIARGFKFTKVGSFNLSLLLAQGGEFAFVIFKLATFRGVMTDELDSLLTVIVTISMALSPLVYLIAQWFLSKQVRTAEPKYDDMNESNPVIIAGFGRFGQVIARIIRMKGINFTALEHDPSHVEVVRKFGNKIYYGDASRLDLLESAGAAEAKLFILAISDLNTSIRTAEMVKKHFPHLKILARARNREHYFRLNEIGIDNVIRDTFHSSLVAAQQSLESLGISEASAKKTVDYFHQQDIKLIKEQSSVFRDEEKLIATSKVAMAQLDQVFASDPKEK